MKQQNQPQDMRNLLIAVLLSALVFVGADYLRMKFAPPAAPAAQTAQTAAAEDANAIPAAAPGAPTPVAGAAATAEVSTLRADEKASIAIQGTDFDGRVALLGGRIDLLKLPAYKAELGDAEPVQLLHPAGKDVFFYEAGWLGQDKVKAPDGNTLWKAEGDTLGDDNTLTLTWDNGQGQLFQRTYTLNPHTYTISITDGVSNNAKRPVTLTHYSQIHRGVTADLMSHMLKISSFTHFVGPQALVGDELHDVSYKELRKDGPKTLTARSGWAGISTPYFLTALVPDQSVEKQISFRHSTVNNKDFFSLDVQQPGRVVQPGEYAETSYTLFVGPKIISLLKADGHGLDRAVDFGWYHVIAKMFFDLAMWIYGIVGNLGVAVILMTLMIKLALWPLAAKSYRAMSEMKRLQPKMAQLKEKYGDNREALGPEMMALYRQHKVNPMSGCWPMLVQIPIFFAFYKMILISFEFRQAPFFFWIHDLSARDPYFVLPVIMGITMLIQQRLNPTAADPVQARVMQLMPLIFTAMFAMFPAGLVLYWTTNSIVSVSQQYFIMRRMGIK